ncbi:response regulator transcription factor [Paenibacillus sp. HW567]|uniref:response regulator transcription factor n=1 Tax=Paenibacillus sp. HW567 TaxID=1034769 RepID=UPI00035FCE62|nr:response regulator [Paenibacillus sp. HW567]
MHTFIVIDDEYLVRKGLIKKIQSFEQELVLLGEAENGEDALELIEESDPDLILTDMRMPVMDGKSLLRVMQMRYPAKKIIVISGHSDFEYMQEAISARVVSYVLKPFSRDEIHQALRKAIDSLAIERSTQQQAALSKSENEAIIHQLDQQKLLHLILDDHTGKPLSFQSGQMNRFAAASYYVLLTVYSSAQIDSKLFEGGIHENYISVPHPVNEHLVFVIFASYERVTYKGMDTGFALHSADQLLGPLRSIPYNKVFAGLSAAKSNMCELNQAQKECLSAMNRKGVMDFGSVFLYNAEDRPSEMPLWNKSGDLMFYLEAGHSSKVRESVVDFFTFYMQLPSATLFQLKHQCQVLAAEIKQLLGLHLPETAYQTTSSSMEAMLHTSFDPEEIRQYFMTVLPDLAELLKERSPYSSPNVIDNVKVYLHRNYLQDLTLEKVSSLFFMNSSYLSHLFKEKTGENFTDYINKLRIEDAKALLKTTDDKVYIIANALGFENEKYFFRLFKKSTGLTPEAYRNQS